MSDEQWHDVLVAGISEQWKKCDGVDDAAAALVCWSVAVGISIMGGHR